MGEIYSKFDETKAITAIRGKTILLPKINDKLQCVYSGSVSISVLSTSAAPTIKTVSISTKSNLQ